MADIYADNPKKLWQNPALQKLLAVFAAQQTELRLVGGCVRDALLGVEPHDIDLATTALPHNMLGWLKAAKIKALPTGLSHGTITAIIKGQHFQITTLRADIMGHGRHATVAFGASWFDDAARRDFTINALSCDAAGVIYDYFDGLADLKNNHVRFVGNVETRLNEDYLRLLRYVRFWLRFDRQSAWPEALKDAAPKLVALSRERVRQEWFNILMLPHMLDVLPKLQQGGFDKYIDGYTWHIDALHDLLAFNPRATLWARLAALYGAQNLRQAYKLSKDESKRLSFLVLYQTSEGVSRNADQVSSAKSDAQRRKNNQPRSPLISELSFEAGMTVLYKHLYHHPKDWVQEWADLHHMQANNILANYTKPTFPITGADLLAAGIKQGPQMSVTHSQLLNWYLGFAPHYPDKNACLGQLKTLSQ
jgi:poly(A) polymerase